MRDSEIIEGFLGPAFQGRRFLRVNELIQLGLIPNRQTLADWIANGHFPAPIHIGKRIPLFLVSEIVETLAARAAARKGAPLMETPPPVRERRFISPGRPPGKKASAMVFLAAQWRDRKTRLGDQLDRAVRLLFAALVHDARGESAAFANVRHEFLAIAARVGAEFPNLLIEGGVDFLTSRLPGASRAAAESAVRTDIARLFGHDLNFPDLRRIEPWGHS